MLHKLQLFFEENHVENEELQRAVSLTKKVEKMQIKSKTQKLSVIFLSNDLI